MQNLNRFLNPRQWCAAVAATLGLAAGLMPIPLATAATVTLNGGTTSCTYSGSTVTSAGDFTFNCTGGSSPGVLSLNLTGTATSLAPNGTTTFAVSRTGQTAGSGTASVDVAVTGGGACALNANSVSFGDGSAIASPANITLTAGPNAATTCTISLSNPSGATLGSPSTSGAINIVDPNAPVVFAFTTTTATTTFGGPAVGLTVTRTGGTAGAWDVPFVIGGSLTNGQGSLVAGGGTLAPATAGGPPATGKITFPAGSGASQSITYTPPGSVPAGVTAPADLGVQLLDPVAVGTPPPGHTASLGGNSLHVTTVSIPTGCTTTATHTVPWTAGQMMVSQVKPNETGAIAINPTAETIGGDGIVFTTVRETSTTGTTDIHFTVSACPGDFSPPIGNCAQHTQYTGGTLRWSIGPKPASTPWYMPICELPAGTTTVYFNIRQIKRPTPTPPSAPGIPSCQYTTCPIFFNLN